MNRRTFIKGTIGLSIVVIAGCTETETQDKSENKAIETVNTDSATSFSGSSTRVTVIFKEVENGKLQFIAYEDNEIINAETVSVIDQKVVTHKFSTYYPDIDVKFTR